MFFQLLGSLGDRGDCLIDFVVFGPVFNVGSWKGTKNKRTCVLFFFCWLFQGVAQFMPRLEVFRVVSKPALNSCEWCTPARITVLVVITQTFFCVVEMLWMCWPRAAHAPYFPGGAGVSPGFDEARHVCEIMVAIKQTMAALLDSGSPLCLFVVALDIVSDLLLVR